jgi:hypothetical protein
LHRISRSSGIFRVDDRVTPFSSGSSDRLRRIRHRGRVGYGVEHPSREYDSPGQQAAGSVRAHNIHIPGFIHRCAATHTDEPTGNSQPIVSFPPRIEPSPRSRSPSDLKGSEISIERQLFIAHGLLAAGPPRQHLAAGTPLGTFPISATLSIFRQDLVDIDNNPSAVGS